MNTKTNFGGLFQFFMERTGGDKFMSSDMVTYWIASGCTIDEVLVVFNSQWSEIGHYYEPIPHYHGKVLKYRGIATSGNMSFMMKRPGMLILSEYKGDRITDKHELFTG